MKKESSSKAKKLTDVIHLHPVDALFENTQEVIQELPLQELHSFPNHPFQVLEDDSMKELVSSIQQTGVQQPILVRQRQKGGYEIISGHRRKRACELAGLDTIPAIIRNVSDTDAVIQMVDANLQREKLLFSEKAFAYKMKLAALKRKAGRPSSNDSTNYSPLGNNYSTKTSVEILEEQTGEGKNQIFRYIRLTYLIPELLNIVDCEKLPFQTAVELSYLEEEFQKKVLEMMKVLEAVPSLSKARKLKKLFQENKLTDDLLVTVLEDEKKNENKVVLKGEKLRKYFSKEYTPRQMEEMIIGLLEQWQKGQKK